MKLYTLISLAVFSSICFTAGFFLGQETYYDEKSLNLLKQGYVDYFGDAIESQEFRSDILLITLLSGCQKEDCSEFIDDTIKRRMNMMIDKYENGELTLFQRSAIANDIKRAKKLLNNET